MAKKKMTAESKKALVALLLEQPPMVDLMQAMAAAVRVPEGKDYPVRIESEDGPSGPIVTLGLAGPIGAAVCSLQFDANAIREAYLKHSPAATETAH